MPSTGIIGPNAPAGTTTPTANLRWPRILVTVDDQELPHVFSARCSLGYDIRVSEAQIVIPVVSDLPKGSGYWSSVKVFLDAPVTAPVGGAYRPKVPRFAGYLVEFDYDLYPRAVTLICKGPLIRTQLTECNTSGGVDFSASGAGRTDQDMISNGSTGILDLCGLPFKGLGTTNIIGGTGKTLGTVAGKYYRWNEGQSGQDFIDQLDSICLGYRTYDNIDGTITRSPVLTAHASNPVATFTEGQDIEKGTNQQTTLDIKNRMVVTGYDDGTGGGPKTYTVQQANPNLGSLSTYITQQISSNLIEKSLAADSGSGLACEDVGNWQLGELNRTLWKAPFTTPRDDLLFPGATIKVVSTSRLGVDAGSSLMLVQHVDVEIDEQGQFSQTLTCLGGYGSHAPVDIPPTAGFTMTIEQELVIIAGVETTLYTVHCIATASGTTSAISTYAWTATGGTPSSGSDDRFTTTYTSVSGKSISLTVTDANSQTATATFAVPTSSQVQYTERRLYAAGTNTIDDFNGSAWAVHTQSSATVVANAPLWADGTAALRSANDLASAPSSSTPFAGGATVASLWVETDVSTSNVLAGSSDGHLAFSSDGGATWTVVAGPDGSNAVIRCVLSRTNAGQYFALTANGLWRTDNSAATWALVQAAAGGETFRDVNVSFNRIMIAMSGGRLLCDAVSGTAQTFPVLSPVVSDVYAVTADIAHDRFYCYDSTGRTFYHTADGGTTLAQRTTLPGTPHPQIRGLWRDGAIRGLLYIAAGSDGVYKSVDGFNSSGGYYLIRKATIGTSPSGAVYTQVGANGLLITAAIASTTVISNAGTGVLAKSLWNGSGNDAPPTNWQDPGYSDGGWSSAIVVAYDAFGGSGHGLFNTTHQIWSSSPVPVSTGQEQSLLRHHITLPSGTITSATLQVAIDDNLLAIYFNGMALTGTALPHNFGIDPGNHALTYTIPPSLLIPGADNVLALWGQNDNNPGDLGGGHSYQLVVS